MVNSLLEEKGISFKEIKQGGNHLAIILAKKCSGKLYEVKKKLHIPVFEEEKLGGIKGDILQRVKSKKSLEKDTGIW